MLLFNLEKEKLTFIHLQNGEHKAYFFQQNSPSHSATRRKRYLHGKATGMRANNKISDMKSNDNNLDLQQTNLLSPYPNAHCYVQSIEDRVNEE